MKFSYILTSSLLILLVFGCREETEFIVDSDLKLNLDKHSLNRAIGEVSNVSVVVSDKLVGKSISLEFTGGTINGKGNSLSFIASETNDFTYVPAATDGYYFVSAKILSGSTAAVEKIASVKIYSDVTPEASVFSLNTLKDSLRLNVLESTNITISLDPIVTERIVSFEFEGGRINGLSSPINQIEIPSNGYWTGFLSTSTTDTEGIKLFKVKLQNNEERVVPVRFMTDPVDSIISINYTDMTGVLADSNSTYDLMVNVSNHHSGQISLTTDYGKFANGMQTIQLDLQGNNSINVPITTSSVSLSQNIICTIDSPHYNKSVVRTADESLPDFLSLTPSSFAIDSSDISSSSNNLSISVLLGRTTGFTTKGLPFSAEAFQVVGGVEIPNGVIYNLPLKTGVNGLSSFQFYASPGLDPNLPLFFRVTADGSNGTLIETISIDVVDQ